MMLASLVSFGATSCCSASSSFASQSWSSFLCYSRLRSASNSLLIGGGLLVDSDSRSLRKPILGTNGSTKSQHGGHHRGDTSGGQLRFLLAAAIGLEFDSTGSMSGGSRRKEWTTRASSSSFPNFHSSSGGAVAIDEAPDSTEFVEIGMIAETHGIHGELRVRSLTDFPVERFETPGVRYIRRIVMGKVSMLRVELLKGREIPGKQSSWLVTLKGFKTREEASELLGSTMLVSADERPPMDEEDVYIPDLVGMSVILQETKEEIGTIVDVHSSGANDLLRVCLASTINGSRDVQVWIPFVKEIVPLVDKETRRVEITPPAGLLELNVPKEGASKKEIRKQERKTKAKLAAVKKRLTALGQSHVLEGLNSGEESQREALTEQLLSINFSQFQHALDNVFGSSESKLRLRGGLEPPPAVPHAKWEGFEDWLRDTKGHMPETSAAASNNDTARWWRGGLQLVATGKVGVVVLAGGQSTRLGSEAPPVKGMLQLELPHPKSLFQLQAERLLLVQELAAVVAAPGVRPQIPWLVLTSDATDVATRAFFEENAYFGLDESQVYSVDNALVRVADPVFFGFAQEHDADVGVKVIDKLSADEAVGVVCLERETSDNPSNGKQTSESVDLDNGEIQDAEDTGEGSNSLRYRILEYSEAPSTLLTARNGGQLVYRSAHICVNLFSLAYLKKMADPGIKLDFHAAHKCIPCASKNLEHAIPMLADKPNGIKFEQFIFDTFKFCQPEKVALLEVEREEEFAPIKNSVGADSKETARNMVLALQNRHSSLSQENESGFCDGLSPMSLLKAYAFGGSVE
ncbi:hypothetical protein CY35_10G095000 [Sphagnum magellanicum]|nr:hypothetical protein CY35_10G095000 [Sphagnum magellanicum]